MLDIPIEIIYVVAFICAFACTIITTPLAKVLSIKFGAVDYPKDRGMHNKPMPRMGGIAIVFGFMISAIIFARYAVEFSYDGIYPVIIGGFVIFLLGVFDDINNISAKVKLVVQIVAAIIVISFGVRIEMIAIPFTQNYIVLPKYISMIATIAWIIGVTNAVNLIDGLDGLAAGVSSIGALCLMFLAILQGNIFVTIITSALAGACLGFLPNNFNPADIFMGDTGSTFLGFMLSIISVQGLFKSYTAFGIILALLVLGLPICDTAFAILRRVKNKKPIMEADRGHLHHKLVDKGYSQKRAVLTLYCISGGFGITAVLIAAKDTQLALILFIFMVFITLYEIRVEPKQIKSK